MYKEYGGYLPIELGKNNKEYYRTNSRFYNSGRTAIYCAIKDSGVERVWLPIFLCKSVYDLLKTMHIDIHFYNIDSNFIPINIDEKQNDIIIWTNYYGVVPSKTIELIVARYNNVIIDNTQAFFQKPLDNVYNVYSPRKFFGVCDGGILIKKEFRNKDAVLEKSNSLSTAMYLVKSLQMSTNDAYKDSIKNEKRIENEGVRSMSQLTHSILETIDYEFVKDRRNNNFCKLHSLLKERNELIIDKAVFDENRAPMVYPFLFKSKSLRQRLIDNHIYVSQWWKWLLENKRSNEWERYLSEYLLPLPIDQRYEAKDMRNIYDIIVKE